jgi:ADP-heptose:LPS heptosyltransferase
MSGERGNPLLKRVDRWLGIPLVMSLGAARALVRRVRSGYSSASGEDAYIDAHMSIAQQAPELRGARVGVLAPAAIGDTVLASGMIRDLTAAGAEVTLITSLSNAAVAPLIPHVERTISLPVTRPHRALVQLRRERFDILIDITPWPRLNALLSALSGAKFTVGFSTPAQYRHYAYDAVVEHSHLVHQSKNCTELLTPFGIHSLSMPKVEVPKHPKLPPMPERYVVFHAWPGGFRSEFREWPTDSWRALGAEVAKKNLPIVLTGGKADKPRSAELAAHLAEVGVDVHDLSGQLSLAQTAAVLEAATGVVSVDTGILHVGSAVAAPIIGLHGPSSSRRWGAIGHRSFSVDCQGDDAGYLSLGFEYPKHPRPCMHRIEVSQVWSLLAPLLDTADQCVA